MHSTPVEDGDAFSAALAQTVALLAGAEQNVVDAVRIDRIRLLEQLRGTVAAAQARESAAFAASQRAAQRAVGVPAGRVGRGIAAQLGLARRVSPFQAARYLGWAAVLTSELPATFTALQAGAVGEWAAMVVARETAWLSRDHRTRVDRELAPRLSGWGARRVEGEAKKLAYHLDPHGYVDRLRAAEGQRRVGLRPAPDTMTRLTGLLPVTQGVAAYAALTREADRLTATGDPRSRGQIMADTLVQRLTGQATAEDVPVEVNLIITDHTLLAHGPEPAHLLGYGPLPAPTARHLALHTHSTGTSTGSADTTGTDAAGTGTGTRARTGAGARAGSGAGTGTGTRTDSGVSPPGGPPRWLRRLFTAPDTGQLVAMESRRRCFTPAQRHYLALRDQHCRTPYCDAPIRHIDHVHPAEHQGPTSLTNGQGYCAACNHARQAPGWHATTPTGDAGDHVLITTPTGHHYRSHPPDPPGTARSARRSPVERRLARLLAATLSNANHPTTPPPDEHWAARHGAAVAAAAGSPRGPSRGGRIERPYSATRRAERLEA